MTQFQQKSFSVGMNLDERGRANYDRIFRKKPPKRRKKARASK